MKKVFLFLACASLMASSAVAQQKLVDEVQKDINALTTSVDTYKSAIAKLTPAFTNAETKDNAETWVVAGKAGFGMYDKSIASKALGQKVDEKAMGAALIDGYGYYTKALQLDSVKETNKDGTVKLDKSGKPKVKTKYSKEILNAIIGHINDFSSVGTDLYNVKDWDGAAKAWGIFCDLAKSDPAKEAKVIVDDTVIGQLRFFQGIAYWQKGDNAAAVKQFAVARANKYTKKEAYDYALACLGNMNDVPGIVSLAEEAYKAYGTSDPQYVRILINNYLNKKDFTNANKLLDEAITANGNDAEVQNLKGLVVEQESGMEGALPYYKKALELAPENSQVIFNVGRYYFNKAIEVTQKNPNLTGKALEAKVNPLYQEALPYFEKAYKLDTTNTDIKNGLRKIYYQLGDETKLNEIEQSK
jgi:tetratricopeptide (TPR) repeat protein